MIVVQDEEKASADTPALLRGNHRSPIMDPSETLGVKRVKRGLLRYGRKLLFDEDVQAVLHASRGRSPVSPPFETSRWTFANRRKAMRNPAVCFHLFVPS